MIFLIIQYYYNIGDKLQAYLLKSLINQYIQYASIDGTRIIVNYNKNELKLISLDFEENIRLDLTVQIGFQMQQNTFTGFIINDQLYLSDYESLNEFRQNMQGIVMFSDIHLYYSIIKNIGKGGGSEGVYRADQIRTGQKYAMKQINKKKQKNVHRELLLLKQVQHPYVVKLIECYENENFIQIIMEELEQIEIRKFDEQYLKKQLWQLFTAVSFFHNSNIMHRDLKLGNIMMNSKQNIKIIDFGLATILNDSKLHGYKQCGTPGYIAPEIYSSSKYNEKCDIFSLGIIMFELFTKQHCIQGNDKITISRNNQNYDLQYQKLKLLSSEGLNLFNQLITKDPQLRCSADQALEHDFFNEIQTISHYQNMNPKYHLNLQMIYFLINLLQKFQNSFNSKILKFLIFEIFEFKNNY
ncbi:hypothetical protein pb186bvf_015092 [Paramecium bursaria]